STSPPIVVRLQTPDGTPIPGGTVVWTDRFATGNITLSSASTVTDANGLASITITYIGGFLPVDGDVEASYGLSNADFPYTYVSGRSITLMSPEGMSGAPSSVSPTPIVVEVHQLDGTPAVGVNVAWLTVLGDAVPVAGSSLTDGAGRASMGFTYGTTVSNIRATEVASGISVLQRLEVSPMDSLRLVSGEGQTGTSGLPGGLPITVEVLDSTGTPIAGRTINWSQVPIEGIGVILSSNSSITNGVGQATVTFTYQEPGRTTITANDAISFRTVSTRAAAVGMNSFTVISGDNQNGLIGSHSAQPLVAELLDGGGQPVVGATVTWMLDCTAGPPGCDVVLDAVSAVTDTNGRVSTGFTFGASAGYTGWEVDDPVSRARAEFNMLTVGANSFSLISGNGQTGTQFSAGGQPLVVEIRDASGAPVAGRPINWSTTSGTVTVASPSSASNASGRASMNFSFGNNGSSVVSAADTVSGQQVLFALVAKEAPDGSSIISGDGQSGLPGSVGAQPIVIEVHDGNNQPAPGQSITWSVLSGPATLLTTGGITDPNGRASTTFNYGPTPGTSIIQAIGAADPNGVRLQATVTSLGSNQDLSVVSGDAQALVEDTSSAPLIVELRDFANMPVAGATISWSASNGSMATPTSSTNAQGRASNTVMRTGPGDVVVHATSMQAAAPAVFTLSAGLVSLPNLTPEQRAVAGAIDNACPALAAQSTLSPQQADLLARCEDLFAAAGLDPQAAANALSEMLVDTAQAQSGAAAAAVSAQYQNIRTRLMALRSGVSGSPLANLSFTGPGGMIPLGALASSLAGEAAAPVKPAGFSRWGFFAAGNIGRGEADERSNTPAYDYDIEGLTAGIDYRQRDNFIVGVALGLTHQDTNLDHNQGDVALHGWSASGYSTWTFHKDWYVDGVLSYGDNRFTLRRRIQYTLPLPGGGSTSIDQLAVGTPDGRLVSAALTFGGDFHHQAWNLSPYGQVLYSRLDFDAYEEDLRSGPGNGLGLAVDSRKVTALTGVLGARLSYSASMDWGVLVPTASLEWNHEFRDDLNAVSAHFIFDPTKTTFSIPGNATDANYLRMSLGLSLVMSHGRSAFALYDRMLGRDGQSQENLSIGIRIEF
ncbi:MAG: autotransporter domain-containing protein, partial [Arenimonas sp.]